ncbi:MAG: hypothetical protein JNN07_12690 [Verrucomicrobiales bacterium]|nr:hypothetical protein [Verrucomicrobiales bacterium]
MTTSMSEGPHRALELADEILALIEDADARTSSELRSDSAGDSAAWVIISGFLISVAANLFTKGLPNPGQGELSDQDLSEIERVFTAVAQRQQELQRQQVESSVRDHLPQYLSAAERSRLTSEIADAILRSCRKENSP